MAFTGIAVVKKVSDRKFRITGLSLAGAAAGTISLAEGAGAVLIDAPKEVWGPYVSAGEQGGAVSLQDAVECHVVPADAAATAAVGSQTPAIVKTGSTAVDFLITLTNRNGGGVASGDLEIDVTFH